MRDRCPPGAVASVGGIGLGQHHVRAEEPRQSVGSICRRQTIVVSWGNHGDPPMSLLRGIAQHALGDGLRGDAHDVGVVADPGDIVAEADDVDAAALGNLRYGRQRITAQRTKDQGRAFRNRLPGCGKRAGGGRLCIVEPGFEGPRDARVLNGEVDAVLHGGADRGQVSSDRQQKGDPGCRRLYCLTNIRGDG